jgi:hypothetical protein
MSQDKKINISLKTIDAHSLAEKRKQSQPLAQSTPMPIQNILNTPIPELLQQYINTKTPLPDSLQKIVQHMRQSQQVKTSNPQQPIHASSAFESIPKPEASEVEEIEEESNEIITSTPSPAYQSQKPLAMAQTPIPKNNTVQRALEAFFGDQPIATEELNHLQLSTQGISVQRQQLIDQILEQKDGGVQQDLIKELKNKFGLGADLRILYLSLDHENDGICLEAFKNLESLIPHISEQSRLKINAKITQIELRRFQPKILEACQRLKGLMR